MKNQVILILSFISCFCFAQKRIGFGIEYSNALIKNSSSFGLCVTSQKTVRSFGFTISIKAPASTNRFGKHSDPTIKNEIINTRYTLKNSVLLGLNYCLKKTLFTINAGYSETQDTRMDYFIPSVYQSSIAPSMNDHNIGKYVSPIKKNIFCFETLIGYNIIEKPKFALNTAIGYNNNYGVVFNLNFLFSKQH